MPVKELLLAAFLGLGVAASTGLNTSLPLLLLGAAAHFHLAGVVLHPKFAWLASEPALIALTLAAIFEIVADKFPAVDHALDTAGTFVRPLAGSLAAASVFAGVNPLVAAIAGLIIGAPVSLGFHAAKASTRIASSATTLGCANPLLSLAEDVAAVVMSVVALLAPVAVPFAIAAVAYLLWRLAKRLKTQRVRNAVSS